MNKYEEDQGEDEFANEKVIIGLVAGRGRKHSTQVKNIPSVFDLDRIFKYWRKQLKCGGSIKEEQSTKSKQNKEDKKYFIQLHGDHRDWVEDFIIYMGIMTKENIRTQGKAYK